MKRIKGDSWLIYAKGSRSAGHYAFQPGLAIDYLGFRLLVKRNTDPKTPTNRSKK